MTKSETGSGGEREKTGKAKAAPKARRKAGSKQASPKKASGSRAAVPPPKAREPKGRAKPPAARRPKAAPRNAPAPSARKARSPVRAPKLAVESSAPPDAGTGLSEEDAIRSAKYLPRELPRVFEEERFIFPESYGVNRVRLLVKDPEWLFAYWDVNPASFEALRREVGERALALSRLTLRISDPVYGGSSDILLPPGARSWYVRVDSAPRRYKAELGVTLPSGSFRRLAQSNVVGSPRVGPSPKRARRRVGYGQAGEAGEILDEGVAESPSAPAGPGPWSAPSIDGAREGQPVDVGRGGASDAFRPGGASDVHRR